MFAFIRNRGGAGRSISRRETVERLNPLIDRHNRLMYAYEHAMDRLADREAAGRVESLQAKSRTDIGKLSETIVSNGGTPPLGTEIRPAEISLGSSDAEMLSRLKDMEKEYNNAVRTEQKLRHHMRSFAILKNVLANSDERLDHLNRFASEERKKTAVHS